MATDRILPQEREPTLEKAKPAPTVSQSDFCKLEALNRLQRYLDMAELERCEPECQCRQSDADLFDATGCDLHNPGSWWNVALRSLTAVQRLEEYETTGPQECPF